MHCMKYYLLCLLDTYRLIKSQIFGIFFPHSVTEVWGLINMILHIRILSWMVDLYLSAAGLHLSGLPVRHRLSRLQLVSNFQRDEEKEHSSASGRCQGQVTSPVTTKLLEVKKKRFGFIYCTKKLKFGKYLFFFVIPKMFYYDAKSKWLSPVNPTTSARGGQTLENQPKRSRPRRVTAETWASLMLFCRLV